MRRDSQQSLQPTVRLPLAHRVMPRGEGQPRSLREKWVQGPWLDRTLSATAKAAEAYWASPSPTALKALLFAQRHLGAWQTIPQREVETFWVLDPAQASRFSQPVAAPLGFGFAKPRKMGSAMYRSLRNKRLLGLCVGGLGDLVMFSHVARAWREQWQCEVDLLAYPTEQHTQLLQNLYAPSQVHTLPIDAALLSTYDYVQPLGLHQVLLGETFSAYVYRCFGVHVELNHLPTDDAAIENIKIRLEHRHGLSVERGIIFVQAGCRPDKRYPHTDEVVSILISRGHQVALIGDFADSVRLDEPGRLANLCGLDVWTTIQALSLAKAALVPDSLFLHVAGGMGVPTVALFGPSPLWWAEPYASVTTVTLPGACAFAPCWVHQGDIAPCGIPADRPCLAKLSAVHIAERVEHKLAGRGRRHEPCSDLVVNPVVSKKSGA